MSRKESEEGEEVVSKKLQLYWLLLSYDYLSIDNEDNR